MKHLILTSLFAATTLATAEMPAMAKRWQSDTGGTRMEIAFSHSNLFNLTMIAAKGSGAVDSDGDDLTTAHFTFSVPVGDLTPRDMFSNTVVSASFLDAGRYPAVTFSSDRVVAVGPAYRVDGELTAHGVTRPISFAMTASKLLPFRGTTYRAFTLTGTIVPKEFCMTYVDDPDLTSDPQYGKLWALTVTVETADRRRGAPPADARTPPAR